MNAITYLAQTQIPGEWITSLIVAVITAAGGVMVAYKKGQANPNVSRDVNLKEPIPEMPVKRIFTPPTFSQHQDVVRRVAALEMEAKETREHFEGQLRQIRNEQHEQFVKLMEAGEARKDMIFEKIESMARGFHHRVDQMMSPNNPRQARKS